MERAILSMAQSSVGLLSRCGEFLGQRATDDERRRNTD